jgi:hypothetical protein
VVTRPPRHGRRGSSERGATLFVVVLAITMLTGIGLFTVHSSALLARAAGNEREALQTTYLAELAALTTLSVLGSDPQVYFGNLADQKKEDCRSTLGINTSTYGAQKCIEMSNDSMPIQTGATLFAADSFGTTKDARTGTYAITGKIETETTDIDETGQPVAGMAGGFTFRQAKITATATLQPAEASAACVENVMQAVGQHMTRAHVLVGPLPSTQTGVH